MTRILAASKRITASTTALAIALMSAGFSSPSLSAEGPTPSGTVTPIKHVIIIVGENRSFDHVFGAYQPPKGETVYNLLSQGIIKADGTPGPNFALAKQYQGSLQAPAKYSLVPTSKTPYQVLPAPNTGGTHTAPSDANPPPFASLALATQAESAALLPEDLQLLTTGASGLPKGVVDTRIANATNLPSGPFQLTPSLPYDAYAAGAVHRFYQNWQQLDCSIAHATKKNPSGCLGDLFAWVEVTIGAGSNGKSQPTGFNDETTHEGASALGFYNTNNGDMPYFTALAQTYALSDNYHQPVSGGTGANSIMLGTADAIYYTDGQGHVATPPANQIENPDPAPSTNNWYTQDGYSGGSYSNCSDPTQPGVGAIISYLRSLPHKPRANCAPGAYYLLNNYDPGYNGDGSLHTSNPFTIPPSPVHTIANRLNEKDISWKYYGEGWNSFVANSPLSVYCNICNPFLYQTAVMTNPSARAKNLKDTTDLYSDIASGELPAVSYVKPGGLLDGHPTSSKFDLFEAFTKKIILAVQNNPKLWADTAIFVTVDEGGGYYDSGYVQPLDFFGDGPRIPLIVVSPYSTGGHVVHTYYDHASLLKFIERNWSLQPITHRSRDNLPNPVAEDENPYVPVNSPAIGDLFEMFDFGKKGH
ncbi:alkaline phosphatase family protein [Beijerinckia indica]|nr:alkaline phosphatase family protein [Beijerinckia indica]